MSRTRQPIGCVLALGMARRVAGLLLAASALVLAGGCLAPDAIVDDSPTSPGAAVWLPGDGLAIPDSVRGRVPLPLCGVIDTRLRPDVATAASRCVLGAVAGRRPAELVVWMPRDDEGRSFLQIVRVAPTGQVELTWRLTAPGRPPLWELQPCDGVRLWNEDGGVGGYIIGEVVVFGCAPPRTISA